MASATVANLTIDPEFSALIPSLSEDERAQLEANILKDGCRDALVAWNGLLLDGHNRFEICERNGRGYRVVEQACADRDDAKIWIIRNQFGRRNLAPFARAELALHLEPLIAAKAKAQQIRKPASQKSEKQTPIDRYKEAADLAGMSHDTYAKAKVISERAPEEVKDRLRRGETTIHREYSAIIQPEKRQDKINSIVAASDLPTGQLYPVIYADPPWRYEHVKTENRAIENQYPTMDLDEICALDVSGLATEDAVLFLWATSPKLAESMRVVESWGFTYRTCMVWVKDQIGMGYYARQQHELLLIAARGELPTPEPANRPSSVVNAPRAEHSAKPNVFYALIERMYPDIPKIELFSRAPREGWAAWGNQVA